MAAQHIFGRRSLFVQPSLARSLRVRVELVELFGVSCPRFVATGEWVREGEVEFFWAIDEDDLHPVPGSPHTFVEWRVDWPASNKPLPAGLCLELEDLSAFDIVLMEYLG